MRGPGPKRTTWRIDPRLYQISVLAALLVYGILVLEFQIPLLHVAVILVTVLATQWIAGTWAGLPAFEPRSALISGLSLCLLLRTNDPLVAAFAAVLAIAPKFLVRWKGKHLFNPTNGALVALLLVGAPAWVSPGQWGNVAFFGFLMACLGGIVVNRAERSDVTFAFIVAYGALVFGRAIWLGDPMAIPLHMLRNGALLLFTFFMISDPRTTPDSRSGRILFASLVAFGAWYVQFRMFRTNGLLWSLALVSLLTPLIDRFLPGKGYRWADAARPLVPRETAPAPAAAPAPARWVLSLTGRS